MSPSNDSSEPLRKRARSDISSEERKEARAHRNRIAAQNSRDRRKVQFSYLERRVGELEEENRQLRVSIGLLSQGHPAPPVFPVPFPAPSSKSVEDVARDRENAELKERIRTLERGWDAVVKALAAQGLPTGLGPTPAALPSHPQPSPATSIPSPAPSHSSLDFDSDVTALSPSSTPVFVPTSSTSPSPRPRPITITDSEDQSTKSVQQDSTRHLARVASTNLVALQRVVLPRPSSPQTAVDEQAMEELFREILVPVPSGETVTSSVDTEEGADKEENSSLPEVRSGLNADKEIQINDTEALSTNDQSVDWANEIEMQKLLDSLQSSAAQQPFTGQDFAMGNVGDLGLSLTWNELEGINVNSVDVF